MPRALPHANDLRFAFRQSFYTEMHWIDGDTVLYITLKVRI
jgi:hypothetical protein